MRAWVAWSNCDLAFFGACYSAVPEAIAPVAAKGCGARHAVGLNPGGLCGDLVYDFHEYFWAKWGEGKSVEEALAWAEYWSNKEFLKNPSRPYGDCNIHNARIFTPGGPPEGIDPNPNDPEWSWNQ